MKIGEAGGAPRRAASSIPARSARATRRGSPSASAARSSSATVEVGARVREGQVLARLDPEDLAQAAASARAQVASAGGRARPRRGGPEALHGPAREELHQPGRIRPPRQRLHHRGCAAAGRARAVPPGRQPERLRRASCRHRRGDHRDRGGSGAGGGGRPDRGAPRPARRQGDRDRRTGIAARTGRARRRLPRDAQCSPGDELAGPPARALAGGGSGHPHLCRAHRGARRGRARRARHERARRRRGRRRARPASSCRSRRCTRGANPRRCGW